jgi:hypothetical protein
MSFALGDSIPSPHKAEHKVQSSKSVLVQFGQWGITTQLQNRGAVATGSSWHHSSRKKTRSFRWLMVAQLDPRSGSSQFVQTEYL